MLGSTPSQHIVFYGSIYKDKEFTMFKPDDNNFEQSHFAAVLALTKENLENIEKRRKLCPMNSTLFLRPMVPRMSKLFQ